MSNANDGHPIHQKIFYSTSKYILLKNIFMVVTGVIGIFVLRILGPGEYGKYALVWQLIGSIGPIISLGWLTTLAKFIPERETKEEKSSLFFQSLALVLIFWLVFAAAFILFGILFAGYLPKEIKDIRLVFVVFILLVALFNIFEGMFRGLGKFNEFTVIDGLKSNLGSIFAIILLVYGFSSYKVVIYSNFLFVSIFAVYIIYYLKKYFINVTFNIDSTVLKFTLIVFLGQIVHLLVTSIDSVLLRALLKDTAQVGYYNAGIKIPRILETVLIAPLTTPFLYYFSHPDTHRSKEQILEFGSRMLGIFFGLVSLFLFSFAKDIILILFGKVYLGSINVLRIFSLNLFILGYTILMSPYFVSVNKPIIPVILSFITFILFFIFNLLLIPQFKAVGPTISIFIGSSIQAMIMVFIILKADSGYFRKFVLLYLTVVISVITGYFVHYYLAVPVYIILILVTGLFTFSDIKAWKRIGGIQ